MKTIELSNGLCVVVDDEDHAALVAHRWCPSGARPYAMRIVTAGGVRRAVWMHRVVAQAPDHLEVDHVNGNRLDNRRANLRPCTRSQNAKNLSRRVQVKTSRFKGVHWNDRDRRWYAVIHANRKRHHIGCFSDELAAARAYDNAARTLHGEFARLNFQGETR